MTVVVYRRDLRRCRSTVGRADQVRPTSTPARLLRRLAASRCLLPLENVQDIVGHSSPVITKLIYVEATRKIQREAVDRLDYLFLDPEDGDDGPATVGSRR